MLEVCIDSLESAINAIHGGADELEVCSSLVEGGLTPSVGLVKNIREMIDNIEVRPIRKTCRDCSCSKLAKKPKLNVMIRCRTGSDFHYMEEEIDTMLSDMEVLTRIGVDRFVFGALTASQEIDEINCAKIKQAAQDIPVTFHRAYDMCLDPHQAVAKIIELGYDRLLTSGQKFSVNNIEAVELIKVLVKDYGNKLQIMPGAGINVDNAKMFIEMGCKIVHSSCKRVKHLPELKNMLTMGSGDSEFVWVTDENTNMLEVCIDSLESAINAIHGGADELEVCSSLVEGGLTPSVGLVKNIREMIDNIEVRPIRKTCRDCSCSKLAKKPKLNVMIRCRTGSDFHYMEEEIDTMLSDMEVLTRIGVDRFVFGALTASQEIDEINCAKIKQAAQDIPVTFHRAYDMCLDPHQAVAKIIELGYDRLLTSGQKFSVNNIEAVELIKVLVKDYGNKLQIMPGAGINVDNAKMFIEMGCKIVHSSCKRVKHLPELKNMLTMGSGDSEFVWVTDENTVRQMKETLLI